MNFLFDDMGCEEYYRDQEEWGDLEDYDESYDQESYDSGPPDDPFGDIYVPVGDDGWGIDPAFLDFILGD